MVFLSILLCKSAGILCLIIVYPFNRRGEGIEEVSSTLSSVTSPVAAAFLICSFLIAERAVLIMVNSGLAIFEINIQTENLNYYQKKKHFLKSETHFSEIINSFSCIVKMKF